MEGKKHKKKKKERKNNAKFSGHYICQRTHNVHVHAFCSDQKNNAKFSGHFVRQRTHNIRAHALRSDRFPYFYLNIEIGSKVKGYIFFMIFIYPWKAKQII